MDAQSCDHKWRNNGTWSGKTPDGKRTGGMHFKCDLCGEAVSSKQQMAEKGGTFIEGTDIYGRSTGDK